MSSVFFLTKNQERVFQVLTHTGESVTAISLRAKLPRTSVYKALTTLERLGLVHGRKVREKNKHLYFRLGVDSIIKKADEAKNTLLGKAYQGSVSILHKENSSMAIHKGKDVILAAIYKIISLHKGERVHVIQGTNTPHEWNKVIGREEAIKINNTFNKNGLLWIGLRSESFIKEFKKNLLDKDYKGRVGDVHVLPDQYFEEGVATYLFKGTLLFIDLENVIAIEINDKKIVNLFKKIFLYVLKVTPREHVG
jgi:predicted transcriptional regulator